MSIFGGGGGGRGRRSVNVVGFQVMKNVPIGGAGNVEFQVMKNVHIWGWVGVGVGGG